MNNHPVEKTKHGTQAYFQESAWPRFLYDLNLPESDYEAFYQELKQAVKAGNLAPFYLSNELEVKAGFVDFLEQKNGDKRSWRFMTMDLQQDLHPKEIKGLEIREVKTSQELNDWCFVACASLLKGRKMDENIFKNLYQSPAMHFYIGYRNGQAVSVSQLFKDQDRAGIYFVGTLPEQERKGFGSALTQHEVLAGKEKGLKEAVLQATPAGAPVYSRLGFDDRAEILIFNLAE